MCGAETVSSASNILPLPYDITPYTLPVKETLTAYSFTFGSTLTDSDFDGYGLSANNIAYYKNLYSSKCGVYSIIMYQDEACTTVVDNAFLYSYGGSITQT
jgi:hypothetical protein